MPSVVKPLFTVDVGTVIVGITAVVAATFVDIASIIDLFTSGCNLFISKDTDASVADASCGCADAADCVSSGGAEFADVLSTWATDVAPEEFPLCAVDAAFDSDFVPFLFDESSESSWFSLNLIQIGSNKRFYMILLN